MPRLSKRKAPEPEPQTDAVIGRDLCEQYRLENEAMADQLTVGEAVQYYDEGWRYSHIAELPESDEPKYGHVRVESTKRRAVWVEARDVRRLK
jgi:hypothetical protein